MKAIQRQKLHKAFKFIENLKSNPRCVPFLDPQQMQRIGMHDFRFVNRRFITLPMIEQKLKQNKYDLFEELVEDIKLLFEVIGNYLLIQDPFQQQVQYFLSEVEKWKHVCEGKPLEEYQTRNVAKNKNLQQHVHVFQGKNRKHYESQRKQKIQNYAKMQENKPKVSQFTKAYRLPFRSTLAQKLQMVYFLKAHETNEPFINMIGELYGIGKETQDEYVIKLDNSTSCHWVELIQNGQQQ